MGSWWRSAPMRYVELLIAEDAASKCVTKLGELDEFCTDIILLGAMQIVDLNPDLTPFQRRYVAHIKRCDEVERRVNYIRDALRELELPLEGRAPLEGLEVEAVEADVEEEEKHLRHLVDISRKLDEVVSSRIEKQKCLFHAKKIFESLAHAHDLSALASEDGAAQSHAEAGIELMTLSSSSSSSWGGARAAEPVFARRDDEMAFESLVGCIDAADRTRFERLVFRRMRGNCFLSFDDFDLLGRRRCVFVALFKSTTIGRLIGHITESFSATLYRDIPDHTAAGDYRRYADLLDTAASEVDDARVLLHRNRLERVQRSLVVAKKLNSWRALIAREKAVYHALGLFETSANSRGPATSTASADGSSSSSSWQVPSLLDDSTHSNMMLGASSLRMRSRGGGGVGVPRGMLRAEGWILADRELEIRLAVEAVHERMGLSGASLVRSHGATEAAGVLTTSHHEGSVPPTAFRTNDFMRAYQDFVNTYGAPRYREVNPALFTAVTFPFLFGMMYGDVGHGSCVAIGGLFLIATEPLFNKNKGGGGGDDDMVAGIYSARYMLFMMGSAAVYAGLLYNDCFSLPLHLFTSSYRYGDANARLTAGHSLPRRGTVANSSSYYGDASTVYPFGVDPIWHISENELLFFNSMKMKTAVIVGVLQMTLGILLRGFNNVYFGDTVELLTEFLPMLVFDACLFLYMVVLIFTKWSIDWDERMLQGTCKAGLTQDGRACSVTDPLKSICTLDLGGDSGGCAPPNLINQLINIALTPGTVDEPMYAAQAATQSALLTVAMLTVPVLLLGKPILLSRRKRQREKNNPTAAAAAAAAATTTTTTTDHHGGPEEDHDGGHDESFGGLLIHQSIETIEFVLGMVSNTASYLRLWALSLAHSELAHVFWDKCMMPGINTENPVTIVVAYSIFATVTTAVLLAMDLLECFLHALRLHWVEFQNKFYKADGVLFQPFDFNTILHDLAT